MGCAASLSAQESEEIFSEVKKKELPPGNKVSPRTNHELTAAGQPNVLTMEEKMEREKSILRGDVVKKHDARVEREKLIKEKQKKAASAAEVRNSSFFCLCVYN
ncbi:hypothetical protein PoB_004234600 [Plakobranchus ocellatus]|uniref:Stathmin n=1 Tax=Plakobranchus ocellatus TaxID=259542 RepID=A0AAV4BAK1_9GAST|nr:hypothetical protein PoB_004234600 [Plakobranchus ocellatus]